jgi:hypothetical protein
LRKQEAKHTGGLEVRMLVNNAGLVEERDEWLVGRFDQQELEGIAVE